jgi:hypothetical protein
MNGVDSLLLKLLHTWRDRSRGSAANELLNYYYYLEVLL